MAERIFRGFLFLGCRIFSRILSPDFFPSFSWEKVPRKILQENPRQNPPKFIQQKSPTHFCRGAGPTTASRSSLPPTLCPQFSVIKSCYMDPYGGSLPLRGCNGKGSKTSLSTKIAQNRENPNFSPLFPYFPGRANFGTNLGSYFFPISGRRPESHFLPGRRVLNITYIF